MKRFRLAIIGTGKISLVAHIPAALLTPLVDVVALIDPAIQRAKKIASEFGLNIEIVPSLEDLKSKVDGAIIAAPNHMHALLAKMCLRRGISVLIEKPIATSVQEGLELIEEEEKSGKKIAVGYCMRFYRNFILLKQLLEKDYFGRVESFAYQFGTPGGWSTYSNYILNRKNIGGGVLVVTGTHFIDRMLFLFGYPDDIRLLDDSLGGPEANARMFLTFGKGEKKIRSYAHFSKTTKLFPGLVIQAEKGKVILPDNNGKDLIFLPKDDPHLEVHLKSRNGQVSNKSQYQLQLEDFVSSCQVGTKPMVSCEEGLKSLELIEDLYKKREPFPDNWYKARIRISQ